jgi:ATP-dependent DNA ligase
MRPDGFRDVLNVLKPAVKAQGSFTSAILDGELCVWNKEASWFEDFSNIRPVLGAAKSHLPAGFVIRETRQDDNEGVLSSET